MKYEKSCGAVIHRVMNGTREYLIVLNKKGKAEGHWGFPKGHTEKGENEFETAAREILEETGLTVVFCGGVRAVSTYSPADGITKDAVYFSAVPRENQKVSLQAEEVAEYRWCSAAQAEKLLTFDSDILKEIEKSF